MNAKSGGVPGDLTERFRRLIRQSGPIPVAQYFGESNAQYYASRDPFGASGDFVTAPEISQLFGEMIGLWCADLWERSGQPERIAYVELGPGRGTLAQDALRVMQRFDLQPEIHFVEGSPVLRKLQSAAIPQAIHHNDLDTLPQDMPILLIANEFFDALTIRQVVRTEQGWRERKIGLEGDEFRFVAGDQPMDSAIPLAFHGAENQTILEACPAASAWMSDLVTRLDAQGGAALIIDYGYDVTQTGSTLQAVRGNAKTDPLKAPGTADLTALVDFAALTTAARHKRAEVTPSDAETVFISTQGAFLERMGITERARALAAADPAQSDAISAAHRRLLAPDEMGTLFKVLAVKSARDEWANPAGFASGSSAGE